MSRLFNTKTHEYTGDDAALVGTNVRSILIKKLLDGAAWKGTSQPNWNSRGELAIDSFPGKKTKILNMKVAVFSNVNGTKWQARTETEGWSKDLFGSEEEAKEYAVGQIVDWANKKGFL